MADEEQPFLGLDSLQTNRHKEGPKSIGAWFRDRLLPKHQLSRISLMALALVSTLVIAFLSIQILEPSVLQPPKSCDTASKGYQCRPDISHFWGQYSPYFKVPSEIPSDTPNGCEITFVQVVSRHGGRDPTSGKSMLYAETIDKVKRNVHDFSGNFDFLANYNYNLGADQLTAFGEQQMILSGADFVDRYSHLAASSAPFIRASGEQRVIESAREYCQGFHQAKVAAGKSNDTNFPYEIIAISEEPGSNNTLNHGLCTVFEASNTGFIAQRKFASIFIPKITARLNDGLPGANLTEQETMFLMDLCPFETIADPFGKPSRFCDLFSPDEWKHYDYYQTIGKYYGYGAGNPLGPTQGVGFVNELIARLSGQAVIDHTSSNSTLDRNPATFPLSKSIYADFGHDNDMIAVFAALGLYNNTHPLSTSRLITTEENKGYSAAQTVPFAARAFFEKMRCVGAEEDFIRILMNGRVLPLETCAGDSLGRCTLGKFIQSLSFARQGGHWDRCIAEAEAGEPSSVQFQNGN